MVTGIAGQAWAQAVQTLALPYLDVLVIGTLGAQDVYADWHGVREIEEEGALLVRPDGVVAWRRATGVSDVQQARSELIAVLSKILAMPKELA